MFILCYDVYMNEEEVWRMAIVYGKPSMTDLPPKLGRRIFEQIRNSKPMADEERAARSKAALERLKKARAEAKAKIIEE